MSEQVIDMGKYQRQTIIPQIGEEGQQRLKNSRVTVIGAGGLGCPVLTYLVEAGVGNIRIIDSDSVSLTNLNRQFLHREADTGRKKTESAEEKLRKCLIRLFSIILIWILKGKISSRSRTGIF